LDRRFVGRTICPHFFYFRTRDYAPTNYVWFETHTHFFDASPVFLWNNLYCVSNHKTSRPKVADSTVDRAWEEGRTVSDFNDSDSGKPRLKLSIRQRGSGSEGPASGSIKPSVIGYGVRNVYIKVLTFDLNPSEEVQRDRSHSNTLKYGISRSSLNDSVRYVNVSRSKVSHNTVTRVYVSRVSSHVAVDSASVKDLRGLKLNVRASADRRV
jgi:hypothetical protein